SSLSRRSLYVGLTWFGIWWISAAVAGILTAFQMVSTQREIVNAAHGESREELRRLHEEEAKSTDPKVRAEQRKRIDKLQQQAFAKVAAGQEEMMAKSAQTNWRLLPSFTANLERIGHGLLDTDAAWVQIGRAVEQARQTVNQPMRVFG